MLIVIAFLCSHGPKGSDIETSDNIGGSCYVGCRSPAGSETLLTKQITVLRRRRSQEDPLGPPLHALALDPFLPAPWVQFPVALIMAIGDDIAVSGSRISVLSVFTWAEAHLPAIG